MKRAHVAGALLVALAGCGSPAGTQATPVSCSCPADTTSECTGAHTAVSLPPADKVCPGGAATREAPPAGYPLGETTVRYAAAGGDGCSTRVTIKDTTPPELACKGLPFVILTSPGGTVKTPLPSATDACSTGVTVTASPPELGASGEQSVAYAAVDGSGNKVTCDAKVTVYAGYPATDLRLAHAEIDAGGTSVVLLWDTPAGSDVESYKVERASSATGPWTTAGTVPRTATSFTDPPLNEGVRFYRVVTVVKGKDGGATEPIRALEVTAGEYDLGVQPVPGFDMPADSSAGTPETMSAPIHAYVRYPTVLTSGPYPLVLLLHGNHGNCRPPDFDATGTDPSKDDACIISNDNTCPSGYTPSPNAQGLLSLAETLASHGYVVATVDANAVNCREQYVSGREDGFIGQRTLLLIEHMRRWRTWASAGGAAPFGMMFAGKVDMGRVVVFGHSRGAEAAAEVPQTFATATDVSGITLAGVFSLAPTNFDDPQPGALPFATLVPVCDGDVYTYNGVQLYDRRLRLTGTKGQAVQVFMAHADHNHFNTSWVFDDNALYLSTCTQGQVDVAPMQRRVLEVVVGSWLDEVLPAPASLEPWLHAVGDPPPSVVTYAQATFPLELRRSYTSASILKIDNFESGTDTVDLLGGSYASSGGFADATPAVCTGLSTPPCDVVYSGSFGWPHYNPYDTTPQRSALALDWNASSAMVSAGLAPGTGTLDASAYAALSLRVSARVAATNSDAVDAPVDFQITIVDGSGKRASALASEVTTIHNLYASSYPRAVLQTVRLALAGLAARGKPAVDLRHLASVELATSAPGQASGSILVTDIELAN